MYNYYNIASELILNSIDSNSNFILIEFNLLSDFIRVVDNGIGIKSFDSIFLKNNISNSIFQRNFFHLRFFNEISKLNISTKTKDDLIIRYFPDKECKKSILNDYGTEIIISNIYYDSLIKKKHILSPNQLVIQQKNIIIFIKTISLNFPKIKFILYFSRDSIPIIEIPKTLTFEEKWKYITGSLPTISLNGIINYDLEIINHFEPFLVNYFPCKYLYINSKKEKPSNKYLKKINGEIKNFQWKEDGLELNIDLLSNKEILIDEDLIKSLSIIGIFDNKFIICNINYCIYAIDQHAAHERINLSYLIENLNKNVSKSFIKKTIKLPININYFHPSSIVQLNKWGWKVVPMGEFLEILSFPLVYGKILNDINGMIEFLNSININQNIIPNYIIEFLKSHSCKISIKFGDYLTLDQTKELIIKLSKSNIPNQCAHGRTVIAPLINLKKPNHTFINN